MPCPTAGKIFLPPLLTSEYLSDMILISKRRGSYEGTCHRPEEKRHGRAACLIVLYAVAVIGVIALPGWFSGPRSAVGLALYLLCWVWICLGWILFAG